MAGSHPHGRYVRPSFWTLAAALFTVQLGGSLVYPIAKVGLAVIEPFTFAFYRYLLAAVVLLILARRQRHSNPIARDDYPRILLLGFLIIPLNQTLFLWGQSLTAAGHGAVIFSTTPVVIFLLAVVHLHERPGLRRAIGVVTALGGALVVMLGGAARIGVSYLWGDLLVFGSVVAWGYYTILGKPLVQRYGALRVTAYALTTGTIMYLPFGLYRAITFDYTGVTLWAWGSVAYMAIGLSLVVYVLWYWLLKHMAVSRIAVWHNAQPVLASVIAYFLLHEPLGWSFVVGGATVIVGVLLAEYRTTAPDA